MKLNSKIFRRLVLAIVVLVFVQACKTTKAPVTSTQPPKSIGSPNTHPPIVLPEKIPNSKFYETYELNLKPRDREFRGVWIATVANIDWPKSGSDSWEKQKADFMAILDYYESLNFNAVIVQIRSAGDAFYPSKYAPWSKYLTGQQGKKPFTTEDPLSWMILQAQQRGMEFHAWMNPYRATFDLKTDQLSPEHDFKKHPEWMIKYGPKYYYNPGLPEVRRHLVNVIKEVVQNYDIDAIHFDDYFYPYRIDKEVFNDTETYKKYAQPNQRIDDWRRENVNALIKEVYTTIKGEKPWVQFGVSPFGVWRNKSADPNGSNTKAGVTNYDELFADPLTWIRNGWVDYLIPQLYWSMDYNLASHRELINWWANHAGRTKIYIGNGPYKIRDNADVAWNNPQEILLQVNHARRTKGISGNAFYSATSLYTKNKDVAQLLKSNIYPQKSITPAVLLHQNSIVAKPSLGELVKFQQEYQFYFEKGLDSSFRFANIYGSNSLEQLNLKPEDFQIKKIRLNERHGNVISLNAQDLNFKYVVLTFIDRYGNESRGQVFEIKSLP
ncbi:glycoside hydrolase family 10 protein [Belliella kenyensis]|uniref:Glycoside hydrolase family 10 protein n=1 Tax=Belliella kenyensis TaxID=1472724 RepID=A0ABV8EJN6_9BACT|nr:family 10 glycosylhydrolase [Belliella kenyensis]MCH7403252.1 family 10 glycosylhydrolase [Belliella kenyensis]MDN3604862.1 family 10 glycosylhydrolase [Belliella kenyensis]